MCKYSASTIAKWFICKNHSMLMENEGEELTILKLLKLLYYAEGVSLAYNNKSLFPDDIVAWKHGPVIESVYYEFKKDHENRVPWKEDYEKEIKCIDTKTKGLLDEVFSIFGSYTAWALRNKTHNERPWLVASDNGNNFNNAIISREIMKSYFKETYIDNG